MLDGFAEEQRVFEGRRQDGREHSARIFLDEA
jgi:hypothetical protein